MGCWPLPGERCSDRTCHLTTISRSRLVTKDVSDDEDRLRELLRAALDDDVSPVRFEPVRAPVRVHRAATIMVVVVVVAFIAGTVGWFRVMADRSRPIADGSAGADVATPGRHVPSVPLASDVPCDVHKPFAGPAQLRAFHPVVALRCDDVARGSGMVGARAVAEGPFGALVRGLERADVVASSGHACATYVDVQPEVFLVDAAGRFLRVRFPRDGCGHLHGTPAYQAYLHLTWRQVSTTAGPAQHTR